MRPLVRSGSVQSRWRTIAPYVAARVSGEEPAPVRAAKKKHNNIMGLPALAQKAAPPLSNSLSPVRREVRAGPRLAPQRQTEKENDDALHGDGQGHQGLGGRHDAVGGVALGHGEV